ncbi:MAG: cytochrome P450 [Bdellovibrionota bacterium]
MSQVIPRRSGRSSIPAYFAISKDPLSFLAELQKECGDFARFRILSLGFCLINDPSLIREALIEKSEALVIQGGASAGLARLIGRGILTNRGENWQHSRKTLQPLFQADAVDTYQQAIHARTDESLAHWRDKYGSRAFSLSRELLALSFRIKCSTLFNYLPTFAEADTFAEAVGVMQLDGMKRYLVGIDFLPWLPIPLNRRVNRAVADVRRIAQSIGLQTNQTTDEIRSILFAGTESPANTLSWAMELLDRHPEWAERARAQRAARSATSDLDIISQILNEVMRLYPAGWAFERYAPESTSLGGEPIGKRTRLFFSPFLLHRNPRFWSEPEKFDPGRFARGINPSAGIAAFSFLPFGAGPRSCIGARLAMSEMRIVLGKLYAEARWKIVGQTPAPEGSFKIRLHCPLEVQMLTAGDTA